MPALVERRFDANRAALLAAAGIPPVLARIYAARQVSDQTELDCGLARLLPLDQMRGVSDMAVMLADAIAAKKSILIVADYDADGATACAVGVRALRLFGAQVDYLVPNRFEFGYGLTPEIVTVAARRKPDYILTVDNGIAAVDGVAEANRLGIAVLVTDHHLPGAELPDAACIVNPNQVGCNFGSKHLAGVGVIFYVMLALRAELKRRGKFSGELPKLAQLLDIVALGTVADVVKLDHNNRILVSQGLRRIRAGHVCAGIAALIDVAGRSRQTLSAWDLAFALGPRLNAAGRLDDMSMGIELLLCDDPARARELATKLDALNRERREIEADMQAAAALKVEFDSAQRYTICLYDRDWHPGVIGILASRLREAHHRPSIAFAPGENGTLKGSGRSINALHLRDALYLVSERVPGVIKKFGGHAMAAGLSIDEADFDRFAAAFEAVCRELLDEAALTQVIETDGSLDAEEIDFTLARELGNAVWGQGFAAPLFCDEFDVEDQRIIGEKHLKLRLKKSDRRFEAMSFFTTEPLPARIRGAYQLSINQYAGLESLQLTLEYWERA